MGKKETGCCSTVSLKTGVLFVNLVTIVVALLAVSVSVFLIAKRKNEVALLMGEAYFLSTYLILLAAIITLITGIVGFVAIIKNIRKLMIAYVSILAIILAAQIASLLMSFFLIGFLHNSISSQLNSTMLHMYLQDSFYQKATDDVQKEWKCCGIEHYQDWKPIMESQDSLYVSDKTNINPKRIVPASCCKTPDAGCDKTTHPSTINHRGCLAHIEVLLQDHSVYIKGLTVIVIFIEIIVLIFGIVLLVNMKSEYRLHHKRL